MKFGKFTACHVFSRQYDGRSLSLSLFPVFRRKNEARGNASRKCCMTGDMIRIWNESTRCKREERRGRRLDLSMVIPIDEILPRFFAKVVNLTCVTITREFRKTEEYRTRGLLHRGLHLPRRRPLYYVSLMTSFALQRAAIVPPAFDIVLLAYIYVYICIYT